MHTVIEIDNRALVPSAERMSHAIRFVPLQEENVIGTADERLSAHVDEEETGAHEHDLIAAGILIAAMGTRRRAATVVTQRDPVAGVERRVGERARPGSSELRRLQDLFLGQ